MDASVCVLSIFIARWCSLRSFLPLLSLLRLPYKFHHEANDKAEISVICVSHCRWSTDELDGHEEENKNYVSEWMKMVKKTPVAKQQFQSMDYTMYLLCACAFVDAIYFVRLTHWFHHHYHRIVENVESFFSSHSSQKTLKFKYTAK